jgi:putative IMPACT (imprinted ancient) family translation regulator
MLDVLQNNHLTNVVVVVTRYFGGVLLGTGGLVRAYQGAVKAGLEQCVLLEQHRGYRLQLQTDYNHYGKIEYLLRERGITPEDSRFEADVALTVTVDEAVAEDLIQQFIDQTGGNVTIDKSELITFLA